MSNKNITMSKLKAIVLSMHQGISLRQIAQNLGISDKTVRNYAKKIKEDELSLDELKEFSEEDLERRFCLGYSAKSDSRFDFLKEQLEQISKEWQLRHKTHVTKELLWEEYCTSCSSHGEVPYKYTQFVFHLNQFVNAKELTFSFNFLDEKPAGKFLEVDFAGHTMEYTDVETGKVVACQVFVGVYPCTNAMFAMPVPSQRVEDFIYCLDCCVRTMGCPRIIICDNLKSGVVKADRYAPTLNDAFESFCSHYGIVPMPARVFRPRDKSHAERYVQVVYSHVHAVLRNHAFYSFKELDDAFKAAVKNYMQSRPKGSQLTREEQFISIEKPACQDITVQPFEVVRMKQLRVMNDSFIRFEHPEAANNNKCTWYSVPTRYIGQVVTVKYSRSLVKIISKNEVIAMHARDDSKTKVYDIKHFPDYYEKYVNCSKDKYIEQAVATSCESFVRVVKEIFAHAPMPESEFRHVDGLFHLQKISDPDVFSQACEIAYKLGNYKLNFMSSLIETECQAYNEFVAEDTKFPGPHENIRGSEYYS